MKLHLPRAHRPERDPATVRGSQSGGEDGESNAPRHPIARRVVAGGVLAATAAGAAAGAVPAEIPEQLIGVADEFWEAVPDPVQEKISDALGRLDEGVRPYLTLDYEELKRRITDEQPSEEIVESVGKELQQVDAARRAAIWRSLDDAGVAYAPFANDTAAEANVRTNYAVVAKDAKTVIVALDNANPGDSGNRALSTAERAFAQDVVEYAKEKGLPVLVMAHVPPNHQGRHSSYADQVQLQRQWVSALRDEVYPNVTFVFGHLHPVDGTRLSPDDRDVDLDQERDGKTDLDAIIIGSQKRESFAKITVHENGRTIEDFEVDGSQAESTRRVHLDAQGRVLADASALGEPTGVFYGTSDVHTGDTLEGYLKALAADAQAETDQGLPVYYLLAGDVNVPNGRMPVHLPQHEHLLWTPGNHCYSDHASLSEVIDFLQPQDGAVKFLVDYQKA